MRQLRYLVIHAVAVAAMLLTSCGESETTGPVRTYGMGERVTLGHIVYVVYETQWLTQLGSGVEAHVPKQRYFLVRMSAVNGSNKDVIVPNFSLEDDNGNTYPELGGDAAQGVPQYIGYLRRVRPAESAQGHALFDAPPRHYKLKIMDEDSEKTAYIDIPLSFTSESPEVPMVGDTKKDQPKLIPPADKK
jgi:Domain of unknown function (DUF4352)